jgi:hypothetical protein
MAPSGTRVIAHEKPQQRASWDPHGVDGWYLGPAPDHYLCYRVHINKTKADRIVDTVEFFPANVAMPRTSSNDIVTIAALELTHSLLHPSPAAPFNIIRGAQLVALQQPLSLIPPSLRLQPLAPSLWCHHNPQRRVCLIHPHFLVQRFLRRQTHVGNQLQPPLSTHHQFHLRGWTPAGPQHQLCACLTPHLRG